MIMMNIYEGVKGGVDGRVVGGIGLICMTRREGGFRQIVFSLYLLILVKVGILSLPDGQNH